MMSTSTAHDTFIVGFPLRIGTVLSETNTRESLKTTEPLLPYLSFYTHKSLSPLLHYATVDICTCPNLQTDGIPTAFLIYISSWPPIAILRPIEIRIFAAACGCKNSTRMRVP